MKRCPLLLFVDDLPALVLAQLEVAGSAVALLIDIAGGRILAANGLGAAVLELARERSAVLDGAMPALARLRALASGGQPAPESATAEPLVFWTRSGAVRLPARIQIATCGPLTVAIVIAPLDTTTPEQPAAPDLFAGDDAAKLKEIARRIRDGRKDRPRAERQRPDAHAETALNVAPPSGRSPREGNVPADTAAASPTLRATLAHELKTPLSAIVAAAEIMKDQRFGPLGTARYVGYAADIHGSAQHVLGVIERMLAEAAEHGTATAPLDFAEIDTGFVLQGLVSQVVPLAERAGIELALELAPRLPHLIADATSLRQIVLNLVTNALKFTGRGGRVTIAASYTVDGPVKIAISDTGSGMTRREIDRVLGLNPGVVTRSARPGKPTGLGLGLPLVQALAAANGAELIIESAPGKGTSASVVFGRDRVVPV